jgi:hypothetical protein
MKERIEKLIEISITNVTRWALAINQSKAVIYLHLILVEREILIMGIVISPNPVSCLLI